MQRLCVGVRVAALVGMLFGLSVLRASAQLTITDVSPDWPFGAVLDDQQMASGRVHEIAIGRGSTLYAASEWAGVWRSTDSGKSWAQSTRGLRTGITQFSLWHFPVLAVDSSLAQDRLLYATQREDGRQRFTCPDVINKDCNFGGLWKSLDGAATWEHVDFDLLDPNQCRNASVEGVGFAAGQAFVLTQSPGCQLLGSTDSSLVSWSVLPDPPFLADPYTPMALAVNADPLAGPQPVLFACQGETAYRKVNPASPTPAWQIVALPANVDCFAITSVPPPAGQPTAFALVVTVPKGADKPNADVLTVDFTQGNTAAFPKLLSSNRGSGSYGVWAPPRLTNPSGETGPEKSFDVYAADALDFYRWANGDWHRLEGLHDDTWALAFPFGDYDPANSKCAAFAGTDGGVSFNTTSGGSCQSDGALKNWVGASSGLHLTFSQTLTGLSRPVDSDCIAAHTGPPTPCPMLYLGSADTDTWVSEVGGVPQTQWKNLRDHLGDSNEVFIDPALPSLGLAVRNLHYHLMFGSSGQPPKAGASYTDLTPDKDPPLSSIKMQAPSPTGVAQVMTLVNESPLPSGDYLAVVSEYDNFTMKCRQDLLHCSNDLIWRNQDADDSKWTTIVDDEVQFKPGQIGGIYPSGGHQKLTIYVLTSNAPGVPFQSPSDAGQVWRGQVEGGTGGNITKWVPASGILQANSINRGYNLFVNPYDDTEVYAVDLGDQTIKVTRDSGDTWNPIPVLKDIATHHNEFNFACGAFAYGTFYQDKQIFGNQCPLTDMVFVRDKPEIRVAVLYPGGAAFSRDSGKNWIPLKIFPIGQLPGLPNSAFYDPQPIGMTGTNSLFIAFEGKGVIRVDAPFPTLMAGRLTYCPTCPGGVGDAVREVSAVVPTLGQSIRLDLDDDGMWRGDVIFDSASVQSLDFAFVVDDQRTPTFHHDLDRQELDSGVATLVNPGDPTGVPARSLHKPVPVKIIVAPGGATEAPRPRGSRDQELKAPSTSTSPD